ncbi:hypothetical protein ACHHV8_25430 [Paenibacillus sp. TAB 01]|uniref:XkdQ/YqbQ family protein n=1 Tax=Paenibacillus sp. TAB 01 TaxID=3368988 RepID=UPI0037518F4A
MLEIQIDNRDGYLWDISGIVSEATYKTSRVGKASSFEITMIRGGLYEATEFKYNVGDVIRVRYDDEDMFYGYLFTIERGRDEEVKITAYDQLRYLMVNDYMLKSNITATQVIQQFADKYQLKTGELADTGYKIPKISEDGIKVMDIICKVLQATLVETGKQYIFYDNFGELALQDAEQLVLDLSLGDISLMFDYKHKVSIEDSYNVVVLAKDNKKSGVRQLYVEKDTDNIAKWGLLMLFQTVDENMNEAQINQALKNLMNLKNRISRSFQVEAIGDIRVRAGRYLSINLEEIGMNQRFMVNDCTHKFEGNDHTMTLDLFDMRIGDAKVEVAK